MTATRLVFVSTPSEAGPPRGGTTYVVLDTAWTSGPGDRDDLVAVRPAISAILARHDLSTEALGLLDAWALEARLDDAMLADGVAWWYSIRPFVWYALHEAILWRRVIGELERGGPAAELEVPTGRPLLEAAAHAVAASRRTGATVVAAGAPPGSRAGGPELPSGMHAPVPAEARGRRHPLIRQVARVRRLLRGIAPSFARRPAGPARERLEILDERVRALAGRPGTVLSVANPRVFQVVASAATERVVDPQLAPVLDRLAEQDVPIVVLGLALDHLRDADWAVVAADPALLPASYLPVRWGRPGDADVDSSDIAACVAAMAVPLIVDDANLSLAVVEMIGRSLPRWLDGQRRLARQAERLIAELHPAVLLLNHEGVRMPWLAAARQQGLRVVAVQHGVIYPTHPVYRHARLATIPLPDLTCVYGPYERDVLLEHGGYRAASVAVTGSPRLDVDGGANLDAAGLAAERRAVRRELGVADGDRLLVVSTASPWIVRHVHLVDMIARTLGGPLPGVHVLFKQHPGEKDEGPYRDLMLGLARAGGFEPPPISVVRQFDLYRLLRAADAHLGLSSTVLTDAVAAGTPNLISVSQAGGDLLGYVEAGVARPVRDVADVLAALADPPVASPEARAAFLARHFREGDAVGRIVAAIRSAMEAAEGSQG